MSCVCGERVGGTNIGTIVSDGPDRGELWCFSCHSLARLPNTRCKICKKQTETSGGKCHKCFVETEPHNLTKKQFKKIKTRLKNLTKENERLERKVGDLEDKIILIDGFLEHNAMFASKN